MPQPPRPPLPPEAVVRGTGLFTGMPVTAGLRLAREGRGIYFRRTDLPPDQLAHPIAGTVAHVLPEARRTVLAADPDEVRAAVATGGPAAATGLATVQTVEHLMSALRGMGIDHLDVEVDGPELPIGDGSATLWIDAITSLLGGVQSPSSPASSPPPAPIILSAPIRVAENGSSIEALPLSQEELDAALKGAGPAAFYTYHLDYSHFPIAEVAAAACRRLPAQAASIALPLHPTEASRREYAREVAPARTFCFVEEAEAMRRAGLFAHASPRDLLVIGDGGPIDNAYRWPDEPARHKLLDLIGDLALCARPILAHITSTRAGHALNHELARRLAAL